MKSVKTSLLFVAVAVSLVCASSAVGATLNVPAEYPTIQSAIDVADDGDIVQVAPGTYTENLVWEFKPIDLIGAGADVTTVNGGGSGSCLLIQNVPDSAKIEGFTFTAGLAGWGGGICNWSSSATVTNCTFSGNSGGGGGMCNIYNSSATVTNCTFSGNSSGGDGGGVYNYSNSNLTLTNCTFSGNHAGDEGGALINRLHSSATVTNCTFSTNSAWSRGGAMFNLYSSTLTVTNCILWGNTGRPDPQISAWAPVVVTYSDVQGGWSGTGNINADPLFADADLRLSAGSPCIDAGNNDAVPAGVTTDLDGNPRIVNGIVDMGAYEAGPVELLLDLMQNVIDLNLQKGIANSLDAKLYAALQALDDLNENNDVAAINALQAFINAVEAQRGKKISQEDADDLIATALEIIALLSAQ